MVYNCPACRADIGRRKLSQAVITRMEIECPICKNMIRLNVHRAEEIVVGASLGTIIVLGVWAYQSQSHAVALAAMAAAVAGSAALPLLERVWLRSWPRYAAIARKPGTGP
jgi:hypothetical protein